MGAELYSKLQTAESSCRILEKQLDYMRKMIEIAKTEKNSSMENQVASECLNSVHRGTDEPTTGLMFLL